MNTDNSSLRTCLLHLFSILLNLATPPSALVYAAYTFKAQDFIFCILIYRHMAGYVNIWCYSIKKRKYINSKIYFTAGRALQHLWQTVWGPDTYALWTAKKQFLGTLLPTRTTHISLAKMFSQCISHLGFFSSASSWKLRLFANCLGFIPRSLLIDS